MVEEENISNIIHPYDGEWISKSPGINFSSIINYTKQIDLYRNLTGLNKVAWILNGIKCIDLTTLSGDDTKANVQRICHKALFPLDQTLMKQLGLHSSDLQVAAVCVYPSRVEDCFRSLCGKLPIASVATGFPSGQYPLLTRLEEIKAAIENGATEIDIVINRSFVISQNWKGLYDEICLMKEACGSAHLKTILATGELATMDNIYKASLTCMLAGADFIKTSTGKETINAILPVGIIMARAIRDFYMVTGIKVGLKPAGGIRTANDIIIWQKMVQDHLGKSWLQARYFRIGASALLANLENEIFEAMNGYPESLFTPALV